MPVKLLLFAILPCPFGHVLLIYGDNSVFKLFNALHVHHVHVICFHVEVIYDVVLILASCLVAVLGSLPIKLVSCVCVEPLLRFECALHETCLVLHVVSCYLVASLFLKVFA